VLSLWFWTASIMFRIEYAEGVADDIRRLRAFERSQLLDEIEEQLRFQPTQQTRNKKLLVGLKPPWGDEIPVWELRLREYRVFYDVQEVHPLITVRAIRHKPPHKTTEEIL
jgi:mRNA-degrading endonuclease RelE of RelBE toxin-antitoxin system